MKLPLKSELPGLHDGHASVPARRSDAPAALRWDIILYFGILNLVLGLGSPTGVAALPLVYILKDNLHQPPMSLAVFGAVTSAPTYVGFLFGFLRDRWRPPGWGDRGYLLIGGVAAIATYLWLSVAPITYLGMSVVILLNVIAFVMMGAAANALMTAVAQERLMTGRLSVVAGFALFVPAIISFLAGGWMVANLSAHGSFLVAAGITAVVLVQVFYRPALLAHFETPEFIRPERSLAAIVRVLRHRPIWPAALILFLWDFSPGWQTPMFYHLAEQVKISSEAYGFFNALYSAAFLPTTVLYGFLCPRMPLRRLLWWGTWLAIAQGPVALLAQSQSSAMWVAIAGGLFGGLGTAAYTDLVMRSCPKGLEGTGIMLVLAGVSIATRAGDLVGSWIYTEGGFVSAIVLTTIATIAIIPVLWWVPSNVTSTREGEDPGGALLGEVLNPTST